MKCGVRRNVYGKVKRLIEHHRTKVVVGTRGPVDRILSVEHKTSRCVD
ncbi:unnamed protein product [Heligmosomoides polygyrus]|uniref:Uncharacterized protein n=1 Tax=Heligmosomoides polygyrus TaxID=6339 RepID=A0A3P7XA34_HELPZ|nr:unnamed protein product [Heligmosomoides polygyrus]